MARKTKVLYISFVCKFGYFRVCVKFVVGQCVGKTVTVQGMEAFEGGEEELGTGWR
jgi:hypothetical protein